MNGWRKNSYAAAALALVFTAGASAETAFIPFEDLQAGDSVLGPGTVHPFLTIESPSGSGSLLVVETGNPVPFSYAAPNGLWPGNPLAANNCLDDRNGLKVDMLDPGNDGSTAKGFADIAAASQATAQEFDLTFEGRRVKSLSVLMTDFGKLIRMPIAGISVIGRNTQGVRLISLHNGEKLVGVERIVDVQDDTDDLPAEDDGGQAE